MSRFSYYVALFLALAALVSAGTTRKGPTLSNAGGVALSADGTTAFISTTSTTNAAVYAVAVPFTSTTAPPAYFTTTASVQYYYIAASATASPQMIWILDNQNAELVSLVYNAASPATNTTLVYNFGIANLDLIDGMFYQPSTNLLFFSFYDHFGGATNDFIGYLNPSAATPTVTSLFTTPLMATLAGLAIDGSFLYFGSVTSAAGNAASIYRVPLATGGATPSVTVANATVIYTTLISDLTSPLIGNGDIIYPAAMQFSRDGSVLYFTDIGNQGAQAASTPHAVYALYDLFYLQPGAQANLSNVYYYKGANTEVQQSFALSPANDYLYFAATGAQNGLYQTTTPNSTFVNLLVGPALSPSAAPTATVAVSSSAAAAVSSSAAARVSSSAAPAVSSSAPAVSSSAAPAVSSSAAPAVSSSAARAVSSSAAAVSSSAAPVVTVSSSAAPVIAVSSSAASTPVASSSATVVAPTGGAASSAGSAPIVPAGTVTVGAGFTFSDAGDALGCLTSNSNATIYYAGSDGGDIFVFSSTSSTTTLTSTFVAGTGSTGASFIDCKATPTGSFVYFLDTRGSTLVRYNPSTPTVAPVVVGTFGDEVTGALTALALDTVANVAYIGTRSSDQLYAVPLGTTGVNFDQFTYAQLANSDITSLFLSADRTTLYYGFPASAQGVAGGIAYVPVSGGTIPDATASVIVVSDVSVIYPDAIWVNGTGTGYSLYFKDGGAFHGQAGPTQLSTQVQTISYTILKSSVLHTLYSTTTINLPPGLVAAAPVTPFTILAFSTGTNIEFVTVVNSTGTAATGAGSSTIVVTPASSSAAARVSSSAAPAVSSSAAAAVSSSAAAAVSSSAAPAVSSSAAAAVSSSAAPVSSSAAPVVASSSAATPAASSSAAAVAASSSAAARVSSSAAPAVSSSAAAASSSAVVVATSSGTRVVGDPMFVGFLRQRFQVHGMDGVVYNILSQASVSINALFVFLEAGNCPIVDGVALTNCWSHPGSYFGSLSLQTAAGDKLEVVSGAAASGFGAIRFDGEEVKAVKGVEGAGAKLSFKVLSTHSMSITIDNYRLVVENSDMFVNLVSIEVLDWQQLASVDQPHGLLGQTWKPSRKARAGQVVAVKDVAEGDVDDYVITSDTLFGTDFLYNKFSKSE